jgi:hypothetical protein
MAPVEHRRVAPSGRGVRREAGFILALIVGSIIGRGSGIEEDS